VAAVVAQRTGIPLETLTQQERERMAHMEDEVRRQVIGQDDAVRRVSERVRMFKAGYPRTAVRSASFSSRPDRRGKTELARRWHVSFQREDHLYRLDMSEYSEATRCRGSSVRRPAMSATATRDN